MLMISGLFNTTDPAEPVPASKTRGLVKRSGPASSAGSLRPLQSHSPGGRPEAGNDRRGSRRRTRNFRRKYRWGTDYSAGPECSRGLEAVARIIVVEIPEARKIIGSAGKAAEAVRVLVALGQGAPPGVLESLTRKMPGRDRKRADMPRNRPPVARGRGGNRRRRRRLILREVDGKNAYRFVTPGIGEKSMKFKLALDIGAAEEPARLL